MIKNKNILVISPEPWGINFVSKHHYASLLSENNTVFFLNPPSDSHSIKKMSDSLNIIDYKPIIRGARFLPDFLQSMMTKFEIKRIEKLAGCTFDVVWNFDSSRFYAVSTIQNKLKICHLVDLTENFQREALAKNSTICFGTTDYIVDELLKWNKKSFKISHGYNLKNSDTKSPLLLKGQKIKVGYVGNLSIPYIRWDVLLDVVQANLDCDFYFVGPVGKSNLSRAENETDSFLKMKRLDNVFFTGAVKSEEIPAVLQQFDILLMCYDTDNYAEQLASPHKVLEYLGAGKVVVATYTSEYEKETGLLEMVEDINDYSLLFTKVKSNLALYNSVDNSQRRVDFARANSYQNQLKKISTLINMI